MAIATGYLLYEEQPTYVMPCDPIIEDKDYEQGYIGPVTGTVKYRVMILDNLDTQYICDALQYVPGWIEFEIVPPDNTMYAIETTGDHIGMHYPLENNLIVVFDGDGYEDMNAAGCSYYNKYDVSNRCGIAMFDTDTRITIGMRVYHEILHGIAKDAEADQMEENKMYDGYQGATVFEQYEYYGFLMTKYRGDLDG